MDQRKNQTFAGATCTCGTGARATPTVTRGRVDHLPADTDSPGNTLTVTITTPVQFTITTASTISTSDVVTVRVLRTFLPAPDLCTGRQEEDENTKM